MTKGAAGYRFGSFRMDCGERLVMHQGERVALRGKAFDLLELLLTRAGQLVDKRTLMDALWPGIAVHENNLAVTVSGLRKALLEFDPSREYVETVPGHGYRLALAAPALGAPQPRGPGAGRAREAGENGAAALHEPAREGAADAGAEPRQPFVAREAELAQLAEHWAHARGGSGTVVFVSGEPGIGKSQLARRFVEQARAQAPLATSLLGQCAELFGAAEPLLPWLEALGDGLGGPGRSELLEALEQYAPAWCTRLPPALVGARSRPSDAVGGQFARADAHELVDALRAASLARPLLLVLEDFHWADASSVDVLRWLAPRIEGHPILVLVTYRPSEVQLASHPLGALLDALAVSGRRTELRLPLWQTDDLVRYLALRFGDAALAERLAPVIGRQSEGLPFFAVGLVDARVERGAVRRANDRWVWAVELDAVEPSAPESVTALIHAELERVAAPARRILDVASVAGAEFGTALLSELLGCSAADLEDELQRIASAHGLLERLGERELAGAELDVRYRFRHVLYQNHLYGALGSHRRVELHQRVARALLAANDASPSRLAFHFEHGRDYPRAVSYWTDAGDQADRAYAKQEALECYERAAHLLARLGEAERTVRRLVLEHGRGWATFGLGRLGDSRRHFLEFARLAGELRHTRGAERETALTLAGEYFQRPWADVIMQRPAGIFPRDAHHELSAEVLAEALHCCCHAASLDGEALLEHASALEQLAQACRSVPRRAEALGWRGAHALLVGRAAEARALLDEALALARSVAHERAERLALELRARLHADQGELASAQRAYEQLLTHAPAAETAAVAWTCLGEVRAQDGRIGAALDAYRNAERVRQRIQPGFPAIHGWLLRELGQTAAARQLDEAALSPLRELGQSAALSRVLASLAITACRQGQPAAARQHLRDAEALVPSGHGGCSWRLRHVWSARCELLAAEGDDAALLWTAGAWLRSARARGDVAGVSEACRHRALALLRRGLARRARTLAEAARRATGGRPLPFIDLRACALLARIADQLGDRQAAAAARSEARDHLQRIARELQSDDERHDLERAAEQELHALS